MMFMVLHEIEIGGGMAPIEPPLEIEVRKSNDGSWSMECDLIRISGCNDPDMARHLFEELLREKIVGGEIMVLNDVDYIGN